MTTNEFLLKLVKVELHIHIEGTLEPEMVFAKALANNIKLPYDSIAELKNAYQFTSLADFLVLYYQNMKVLKTKKDFYDLTWAYLVKAHDNNVHHIELSFDPQPHLKNNVKFADIVFGINEALTAAKQQWNLTSKLIMCFLKDQPVVSALQILQLARPLIKKKLIDGIGLDSSESENWVNNFQPVIIKARKLGLFTVLHAGEEANDEDIDLVLNVLKPQRIDHGLQANSNHNLLKRLRQENIHLTLCPLSNQALQVCSNLNNYPLPIFLQHNISFSINSDDPAYFGGYLTDNFLAINNIFHLSKAQWKMISINSVKATFLTTVEKNNLIKKISEQ